MIKTWWDLFWLIVVVTLCTGALIMTVFSCIQDVVREIKKPGGDLVVREVEK